jgi:hypothetical protein
MPYLAIGIVKPGKSAFAFIAIAQSVPNRSKRKYHHLLPSIIRNSLSKFTSACPDARVPTTRMPWLIQPAKLNEG